MQTADRKIDATDLAFAVVVSRFNSDITGKLLDGAMRALGEHRAGVVDVHYVPGAFELPVAAKLLAETEQYDAIVCLGCVIRGDTAHFEFVAGEAARGIQSVAIETGIPVTFGVLTTETREQAQERAGAGRDNKGFEAALTAIEMGDFAASLPDPDEQAE